MNKVKAHTLRKYEEAKLVEELTTHRVSDRATTGFEAILYSLGRSPIFSSHLTERVLFPITEKTCRTPRVEGFVPAPGQAHDDQAGEEEHRQGADRAEREAYRLRQNRVQEEEVHACRP